MTSSLDTPLFRILLVACGGAAGALLRFGIYEWLGTRIGQIPIATLLINATGCFLAGGIGTAIVRAGPAEHTAVQSFALVGFLGAFTTFSTFGWETLKLLEREAYVLAALNVALQCGIGILAVGCGAWTARLMT